MASSNSVIELLEETRVTPLFSDSADHALSSATEFSLPLTFFDTSRLKTAPPKNIFYFKLAESSPSFFNSVIVPRLKHSLSITLTQFLPLAGRLTWPPHSTKPHIVYTPPNDGVSLIVSESNADLDRLIDNQILKVGEVDCYGPELQTLPSPNCNSLTLTESKGLALQVTNFPNQGFCIGTSFHHSMVDAKTLIMFLKAWAHFSKLQELSLPPQLIPCYDRTPILLQDLEGSDVEYIKDWFSLTNRPDIDTTPRSLKLPTHNPPLSGIIVRGAFELSDLDIKKLRQNVVKISHLSQYYFSTFVLSVAYTVAHLVKARGIGSKTEVVIRFSADFRGDQTRAKPLISNNYFGNCAGHFGVSLEAGEIVKKGWDGVAAVAEKLREEIRLLKDGSGLERAKQNFKDSYFKDWKGAVMINVSGWPRVGFYELDFGWGTPDRVETSYMHQTNFINICDSKKFGCRGVEIGFALNKHGVDMFASSFLSALQEL